MSSIMSRTFTNNNTCYNYFWAIAILMGKLCLDQGDDAAFVILIAGTVFMLFSIFSLYSYITTCRKV